MNQILGKLKRWRTCVVCCLFVFFIIIVFLIESEGSKSIKVQTRESVTAYLMANEDLKQIRSVRLKKALVSLGDLKDIVKPIFLDAHVQEWDGIKGFKYVMAIQYLDESKSVASIKCLSRKDKIVVMDHIVDTQDISLSSKAGYLEHRFMIPFYFLGEVDDIEDDFWKKRYMSFNYSRLDKIIEGDEYVLALYDKSNQLLDTIEVSFRSNKPGKFGNSQD